MLFLIEVIFFILEKPMSDVARNHSADIRRRYRRVLEANPECEPHEYAPHLIKRHRLSKKEEEIYPFRSRIEFFVSFVWLLIAFLMPFIVTCPFFQGHS